MEYTKGEWILDFSEEHNGVVSIYVPKKGTIARIYTRSCDNYKANANLIASAPELYEALEDIVEQAEKTKIMLPADLADSIRVFGRQVLAKAEGK